MESVNFQLRRDELSGHNRAHRGLLWLFVMSLGSTPSEPRIHRDRGSLLVRTIRSWGAGWIPDPLSEVTGVRMARSAERGFPKGGWMRRLPRNRRVARNRTRPR